MKTRKIKQRHIERIMDRFDFEKVRAHMEATDWRWLINGTMTVPDVGKLREHALDLLQRMEPDGSFLSSGGMCVRRDAYGGATLTFEVAEAHGWKEE